MTASLRRSPRLALIALAAVATAVRAQVPEAPRPNVTPLAVGPANVWPLFEASVVMSSPRYAGIASNIRPCQSAMIVPFPCVLACSRRSGTIRSQRHVIA